MDDMATGSLIYRKTAGTGAPEVQSLATLKTDLGLTGTNSGDQTITLTGDVTGSGTGSFATAIGSGKVTDAMLAGSISNAKLANSSVTVGTTAISLGGSSTTLAGLTSVTSTSFVGALTGNASTATKLAATKTINGVAFDGSGDITITAAPDAHTLDSHSDLAITSNTAGELLKWNGTAWINNTLAEAGIQPAGSYLTTETDPIVKAISGIVKSDGTTISAAVAGTDFLTPTGSANSLTNFPILNQSTTGNAATATTATNIDGGALGYIPYQTGAGTTTLLATGTAGQYLKSNGAAAPSWDTPAGGGDMLKAAAETVTGVKTFSAAPIFSTLTAGSVPFVSSTKTLIDDNANLFWDNTNKWLGIGTATPTAPLDVEGDVHITALGSDRTNPREIGITNWGPPTGTGDEAARFTFGDPWNALQNGYGQRMQIVAYHGVDISGSREDNNPLDFVEGTGNDASLNVIGTVINNPVLTVSAPSSQSANIQEWRKNGTLLDYINSTGVFVSSVPNGTAPFTVTSTTAVANLNIGGSAANVTGIIAAANGGTGSNLSSGGSTGDLMVANSATTFSRLTDVAVGRVLVSGGAGASPSYSATPTLGVAGTTLGKISFTGNTSGTVTIQPQATAGTYNFNLPTSAGSVGQPLLSGGGGATAMTFGTLGVGSGGTGLTTGNQGGIPYFNSTTTMASTATLASNALVVGGGSGSAPSTMAVGSAYQVVAVNSAGTGYTHRPIRTTLSADWGISNLTNNQTDLPLRLTYSGNVQTAAGSRVKMPVGGRIVGISVSGGAVRTGGTATFTAFVDNTSSAVSAVIDGTNTQFTATTGGSYSFSAGAILDIRVTTNNSFGPAGIDYSAWIFIEFTE